jgi:ATP-dependent helicase Lhr and Lhr-like helicase
MGGRMPLSSELAAAVRRELDFAKRGRFDSPELANVKPILETQAKRSIVPGPNELLVERLETNDGYHLFVYPFEGRLVHEGLAALVAYRIGQLKPLTLSLAVNDYGLELLCHEPLDFGVSPERLSEDVLASLNTAELAKRQFREVARIAGLVFPGMPNSGKTAKQLQMSAGLFYNVFAEYDPGNLLLHQARQEVLDRQFERDRMTRTLERLATMEIVVIDLVKPTPLGFPLLVDRLRGSLTSEKLADRVKRMIKAADVG